MSLDRVLVGLAIVGALCSIPAGAAEEGVERVTVVSEPPGAEVLLNWRVMGETPLSFPLETGPLLVHHDGFAPRYRQVTGPRPFFFRLRPRDERTFPRFVVTVSSRWGGPFWERLAAVVPESHTVLPRSESEVFAETLLRAGPQAAVPFREWARVYFRASYWLAADEVPSRSADLVESAAGRSGGPQDDLLFMTSGESQFRVRVVALRDHVVLLDRSWETERLEGRGLERVLRELERDLAALMEKEAVSAPPPPPEPR